MKFRVGDKIKVRMDLNEKMVNINADMIQYIGKVLTIKSLNPSYTNGPYNVEENGWTWGDHMVDVDPVVVAPPVDASKGLKYDGGKPRMDLLSTIFLEGVAKVLTFGAKKYAAHNWRNGIEQSRLIGAAMRHLTAYNNGEDTDPESGLSHLDHLGCCVMFLRELRETHPHLDDRYKKP